MVDLSGIIEIQRFLRDNVLTPLTFVDAADLRTKSATFFEGGEIVTLDGATPKQYVWVPADTGTDDGVNVIKPTDLLVSDAGRWRLLARQAMWGTKVWDPGNLAADGDVTFTTVTVTGAAIGDVCTATLDSIGAFDILISAHVSAADTVRVTVLNKTGGAKDLGSGNLNVAVVKA